MYSRHLTTPRGVHGRMDLTIPGGGISSLTGTYGTVEGTGDVRDVGSINRILGDKTLTCVCTLSAMQATHALVV